MGLALQNPILDLEKSRRALGKALKKLQESWQLNNKEMAELIRVKPNTYGHWMQREAVPFQKPPYSTEIELIISLLAIFRSLGAMFHSESDQVLWLKAPHPQLQGSSPLDFARHSSQNLFYLREYLDYVRGRGA